MLVYVVDNIINVIYKKQVYTGKFKSINKGYIINKDEFMNEFLKFLKKEKIKGKRLLITLILGLVINSF